MLFHAIRFPSSTSSGRKKRATSPKTGNFLHGGPIEGVTYFGAGKRPSLTVHKNNVRNAMMDVSPLPNAPFRENGKPGAGRKAEAVEERSSEDETDGIYQGYYGRAADTSVSSSIFMPFFIS